MVIFWLRIIAQVDEYSKICFVNQSERREILEKAKQFFRDTIVVNHANKLSSLSKLETYNYNPFLVKYLARFFAGSSDSISIAKVLLYPRILGTSINTSFGSNIQKFITTVLGKYGSTTSGIDIEFVDSNDGRRKYCQLKSGPRTINKDDVETITRHFDSVRNLARTNNLNIGMNDLVVGVMYGTRTDLSQFYLTLDQKYEVIVGKEFWTRLTGDQDFYSDLTDAFGEVADTIGGHVKIKETLHKLAEDIERSREF